MDSALLISFRGGATLFSSGLVVGEELDDICSCVYKNKTPLVMMNHVKNINNRRCPKPQMSFRPFTSKNTAFTCTNGQELVKHFLVLWAFQTCRQTPQLQYDEILG